LLEKGANKDCPVKECGQPATTGKYCRLHYIAHWQGEKKRSHEAKEKMLDRYVKALTKRFPDEYLEVIKKDLANPQSFKKTVQELDIENMEDIDFLDDVQDFLKNIKKS